MFDFKEALKDEESLQQHIMTASSASVTRVRRYHLKQYEKDNAKNADSLKIVEAIDKARKVVRMQKLQQQLDEMSNV